MWVYTAGYQRGKLLRPLTTRLPTDWVLRLSRIARPLYHVHRVPLVGLLSQAALPTTMDPDPEWRWLGTFDWFSPTYQWKHTYDEVESWFREAGLTDIRRGPFPVSVHGVRPSRAVR